MSGSPETPEAKQLVTGSAVAWVTRVGGKMIGLSSVHRVYDGRVTYCQHEIPEPDRRFAPLKYMPACKRCERLCARAEAVVLQEVREIA